MLAGFFLVSADYTSLQAIVAAALGIGIPMGFGVVLGSLVIYAFAYFGGKPIIARYSKLFGVSWA